MSARGIVPPIRRVRTTGLLFLLFATGRLLAQPVPVPLEALAAEGAADTALGRWELVAAARSNAFPDLESFAAMQRAPGAKDEVVFRMPEAHASALVSAERVELHAPGRQDFSRPWDWLPAVAFTPKSAGRFRLAGQLDLSTNKKGKDAIAFALFRRLENDITPIAQQRLEAATTIDLASFGEVAVAQGESLLLGVWRPGFHDASGGKLSGLAIARTGDLPAVAGSEPLRPTTQQVVLTLPALGAGEKELVLGGSAKAQAVVRVDAPLLDRVVIAAADVEAAVLNLKVLKTEGAIDDARLVGRRVGETAAPLFSLALQEPLPGGRLRAPGLAEALQRWHSGQWPELGITLSLEGGAPDARLTLAGAGGSEKQRPRFEVALRKYEKAELFPSDVRPQLGVWTVVKNGHLSYGGMRLRLWGTIGECRAERLRRIGMNAFRQWDIPQIAGLKHSHAANGSDEEMADYKKHGIFVMYAGLTTQPPPDLLFDPKALWAAGADYAEWKKAAESAPKLWHAMAHFDERLQAGRKAWAARLLDHTNPGTGKRLAEEEHVAIWEIANEDGVIKKVLEKGFAGWPPYFQKQLQTRWNEWLRARYGDDAKLLAAWGKLAPGEALGSVQPAPAEKDRGKFPEARQNDFLRFFIESVKAWDAALIAHCRAQAPKGVGVNVAPFSCDTVFIPNAHWAYTNTTGDVNTIGMYFWDATTVLDKPPSLYVMDNHTVDGMPTVIYETNTSRPNRDRTEYPFRLAAFAAWQDWDAVFWQIWQGGGYDSDEKHLTGAMSHVTESYSWTGTHHEVDPPMCSAIALAGQIFLRGLVQPAPNPTITTLGGKSLFSYAPWWGAGAGREAFQNGARLRFEPQKESGTSTTAHDGSPRTADKKAPLTEAVRAGDEIVWDWPNGRLIIDTPTAKVYAGRAAESYRFKDGITLSGMGTASLSWALLSADTQPLTTTKRALVAAMHDAQNTGFEIDWSKATGSYAQQAKAIQSRGRAPAIVERVDYTAAFPSAAEMKFTGYDFALRPELSLTGKDGALRLRDHAPTLWMGALDLGPRGAKRDALVDASPGAQRRTVANTAAGASIVGVEKIWNPLPGVTWGSDLAAVHRVLAASPLAAEALSPATSGAQTLTWSGAEALFAAPADITLHFDDGALRRITAVFSRPPRHADAIAAYEKQFGPPTEKVLGRPQTELNVGRWRVKGATPLEITLSEIQGTVSASYELLAP